MNGTALIIEDHPLYRDALTALLRPALGGLEVKAVSSAEEGLRVAGTLHELRLVLIDPGLPGMSGAEAIRAICRVAPLATVIAVSASDDRREVKSALSAGARAFVSKAVPADVLTGVIVDALAGKFQAVRWVMPDGEQTIADADLIMMTPRQRDILPLLCQGHSNKEMGLRLNLAEVTVKMHVSSIFRALKVANRTQAVVVARRLGLYAQG